MRNLSKELKRVWQFLKGRKITLRRKLMLYLICLILATLGVAFLILVSVGGSLRAEQQISQEMKYQLQMSYNKMSEELEGYTGYGFQLSRQLGQSIEKYLGKKGISISDLNDHPKELLEIQEMMYRELNTTIRLGRSSGVFAVVDATVNTKVPEAEESKCGVWLRMINVGSHVILSPETILFRGNSRISIENGLEMHNRWNMEFHMDEIPGYQEAASHTGESGFDYYWSDCMNLKGTWEDIILLLIPIRGSLGEFYGICGIELNAVHFNLEYPSKSSQYGSIATVITPFEDETLQVEQGMLGNTEGTWLKDTDYLVRTGENAYYNTYRTSDRRYCGMQKALEMQGIDGEEWTVAVMIPYESCRYHILKNRVCMAGIILGFVLVMCLIAWFLARRFVRPILKDLKEIYGEQWDEGRSYSIAETEELYRWIIQKEKKTKAGELPPDMVELLNRFAQNVKSLTRAEYNIFHYYLNGYEISQIPSAAFISMSTVKKHNGNIYRKLGISSNDELMMYLDLFRRCGCLERLQLQGSEKK